MHFAFLSSSPISLLWCGFFFSTKIIKKCFGSSDNEGINEKKITGAQNVIFMLIFIKIIFSLSLFSTKRTYVVVSCWFKSVIIKPLTYHPSIYKRYVMHLSAVLLVVWCCCCCDLLRCQTKDITRHKALKALTLFLLL